MKKFYSYFSVEFKIFFYIISFVQTLFSLYIYIHSKFFKIFWTGGEFQNGGQPNDR